MSFRPSKRRRHKIPPDDINIVPLMNVFVIIIPFLLLTAVFAKTAIIDIMLPQETQSAVTSKDNKFLSIQVKKKGFRLIGIGGGKFIAKQEGAYDFETLTAYLTRLKQIHPKHQEVILLFDKSVSYELVINVMDASRGTTQVVDGEEVDFELFSIVSLGENK